MTREYSVQLDLLISAKRARDITMVAASSKLEELRWICNRSPFGGGVVDCNDFWLSMLVTTPRLSMREYCSVANIFPGFSYS